MNLFLAEDTAAASLLYNVLVFSRFPKFHLFWGKRHIFNREIDFLLGNYGIITRSATVITILQWFHESS